ncbi:hypothetical protein MICRO8M_20123 [Microbacterium sp. 8M]|nr:hypothetical protein MICRO8M_20123 [Microbacterium sp. 8M]
MERRFPSGRRPRNAQPGLWRTGRAAPGPHRTPPG